MRIASFDAFWPTYVADHRDPRSRWLHLVGTLGFAANTAACAVHSPLTFLPALAICGGVIWAAFDSESRRNAAPWLLVAVAVAAAGSPLFLAGPVFAYGCAWVGHFLLEHNRPATFTYPLWSLAGDFRMCSEMLRGRMWTGDGRDASGLRPERSEVAAGPT